MAENTLWRWFVDPPMPVARRTLNAVLLLAVVGALVVAARHYLTLPAFEFGAESGALNSIILAFLIGFRNKAAYDRWWEGRMLWGKLVNDTRNLCLKYREYARPSPDERRQMTLFVSGFAVALMNHLRAGTDKVPTRESKALHEPLEYAGKVYGEIARLLSERRVDSAQARMLDVPASGLMDVSGACERIRGTPIANSFRALLRRGMVLQLLALVVLTTWELGAIGIPLVLIPAYFLVGMELVAEDIENPFATKGDNLDLEKYCDTIQRSAEQILLQSPAHKS